MRKWDFPLTAKGKPWHGKCEVTWQQHGLVWQQPIPDLRKGICVLDCNSVSDPFFPVGPYTQPILISDTVGVGRLSGEYSLLTKGTDVKEGSCHTIWRPEIAKQLLPACSTSSIQTPKHQIVFPALPCPIMLLDTSSQHTVPMYSTIQLPFIGKKIK